LLHISSKLGKISVTYGGGVSIIKHNIAFSEEGALSHIMGETPFPWLGMGSMMAYLKV
jgi:hypothetical protein